GLFEEVDLALEGGDLLAVAQVVDDAAALGIAVAAGDDEGAVLVGEGNLRAEEAGRHRQVGELCFDHGRFGALGLGVERRGEGQAEAGEQERNAGHGSYLGESGTYRGPAGTFRPVRGVVGGVYCVTWGREGYRTRRLRHDRRRHGTAPGEVAPGRA